MTGQQAFADGIRALANADSVLKGIIERIGPLKWPEAREPFPALVRSIFYQQLAGSAASAIMSRFLALYPSDSFPSPHAVLETTDEMLRSVGLSRQKLSYVKDLSAKFEDGTLNADMLRTLPEDEVGAALMSVKGIGRWTVDMFLIFTLHRLDVFPVGDLGSRSAQGGAGCLRFGGDAGAKTLLEMSERWRPYCSVATLGRPARRRRTYPRP